MNSPEALRTTHPQGEAHPEAATAGLSAQNEPLLVDTPGGRYHVRWDDSAPATPLGQLVFFAQLLNAGELFSRLCAEAPLAFSSPNAPRVAETCWARWCCRSWRAIPVTLTSMPCAWMR